MVRACCASIRAGFLLHPTNPGKAAKAPGCAARPVMPCVRHPTPTPPLLPPAPPHPCAAGVERHPALLLPPRPRGAGGQPAAAGGAGGGGAAAAGGHGPAEQQRVDHGDRPVWQADAGERTTLRLCVCVFVCWSCSGLFIFAIAASPLPWAAACQGGKPPLPRAPRTPRHVSPPLPLLRPPAAAPRLVPVGERGPDGGGAAQARAARGGCRAWVQL